MDKLERLRSMLGWDVTLICDLPTTGTRAHISGILHEAQGMFELRLKDHAEPLQRFTADDIHCITCNPGYRPALFIEKCHQP